MASKYPPDPKNAASVGNPVTPQSGAGSSSAAPEYPMPLAASQRISTPSSAQEAPLSGEGPRRLPASTQLSGGRYRIVRSVAAGGMGAVYRAVDTRFDDEPCAVKEMLDDYHSDIERSQAIDWFKREAKLLLKLNHPCIPHVRDYFVEGGRHYLVMDFIDGRTLAEVFAREGKVPGIGDARGVSEDRARRWAQQVCNVPAHLPRQHQPVIFRDLKPSNVMVTDRDEIKLIDFGIARTFQSQHQSTIIMTLGYAPQEQLLGMPEPRSDIYALGATLHRVLTFHDAANNKPTIFSFPPVRALRPDISPAFEQVIMKALAPAPEQRWSSAAEMERPISSGLTGPGSAYIRIAQDLLSTGRADEAYASIQSAYVLEPNNPLVHKIYGQIFARRRQPDMAIQAYNRALIFNQNDPETHKLVGDVYLYLQQLPAQAIPPYTQSLRLNPGDFETHQRLAKCYEETNQLEPALREYQEVLRLVPPGAKRPDLYYAIGQLAWRLNQLLVAERAFVQVLIINPADHTTRFLLSQVYEREGKLEDALRECRYVVGAVPGNQAALAMLQRLSSQLGR